MSFTNVNDIELNVATILAVHCLQGANLTPEGGSRVRAKNKRDRFCASKTGKLYGPVAVKAFQFKVRRDLSFRGHTLSIPASSSAADSIGKLPEFTLVNYAVAIGIHACESLGEWPGSFTPGDFAVSILIVRLDPVEQSSSASGTIWLGFDSPRQDEKSRGKTQ